MLRTLKQSHANKWKRVHYKPHRQNFHSTHCLLLNAQNLSFTVDQIHMFSQGAHTSCGFGIWFPVATSKVPAQICRFYGNLTIFTSALKATQSYKIKHTWMCLKIWFSVMVAILIWQTWHVFEYFTFLSTSYYTDKFILRPESHWEGISSLFFHNFHCLLSTNSIGVGHSTRPAHYTLQHVARAKRIRGPWRWKIARTVCE